MKNLKTLTLLFLTILTSCSKNDSPTPTLTPTPETPVNVLVSSNEKLFTNNVSNNANQGTIIASCSYGTDIYLLLQSGTNQSPIFQYSKNGTIIPIPATAALTKVTDIAVDNQNVYIVGGRALCVFKTDGTFQYKFDFGGLANSEILSVDANNGKYYLVGYERLPNTYKDIAKYWDSSGTNINLTDGTKGARATSVKVKNGNVHIVGFQGDFSDNVIIKYWKNLNLTNIALNIAINSIYNGNKLRIGITDNDDVYIAVGTYNPIPGGSNDGSQITYWKNGVRKDFDKSANDEISTHITDMTTFENDFYLSGYKDPQTTNLVYWKNGEMKTLAPAPSPDYYQTSSILVTKK